MAKDTHSVTKSNTQENHLKEEIFELKKRVGVLEARMVMNTQRKTIGTATSKRDEPDDRKPDFPLLRKIGKIEVENCIAPFKKCSFKHFFFSTKN